MAQKKRPYGSRVPPKGLGLEPEDMTRLFLLATITKMIQGEYHLIGFQHRPVRGQKYRREAVIAGEIEAYLDSLGIEGVIFVLIGHIPSNRRNREITRIKVVKVKR